MKPKRDKPPEDAKVTGRKGGIKRVGTDMHNTKASGPESQKGRSEALREREDVSERDTEVG